MSDGRFVIAEACDILARHGNRMTIRKLADALGVSVNVLRRQVTAFEDTDDTGEIHQPGFDRFVFIAPPDYNIPHGFNGADGTDDEAASTEVNGDAFDDVEERGDSSDLDVVVLVGSAEDFLGTERLNAEVLGPLYAAAEDLLVQEPDNSALASAATKLREQFLPGVKPRRHYRKATVAAIAEAIRTHRKMRIVYSRAWQPGVTERVIEPYLLVNTRRGYEVDAGPSDEDGNLRTFIISRIRAYDVLDEEFTPPSDAAAQSRVMRQTVTVTGFLPHHSRWAINKYAESVEWPGDQSGDDDVRFIAHVLPPVQERVALMSISAGPGMVFDDEKYEMARAELARLLCEHHGLDKSQ